MNQTMKPRLCAILLTVCLAAVLLAIPAAADAMPCKTCADQGLTFTGFTATTDFGKISQTQCARLYVCNNGHKQLTYNLDGSFRDVSDHFPVKNATCKEPAVCGNCGKSYGAPLEHKVVVDKAVAPTCTKTGLTEGKHCGVCGEVLLAQMEIPVVEHTYDEGKVVRPTCFKEGGKCFTCKVCGFQLLTEKVKPLSHWYAEWEPAGHGKNSAPCQRQGCNYVKTANCTDWSFHLIPQGANKAETYSVCPVCGQLSDGGQLELVEDVVTNPITGWTPEGDLLFRAGTMENGEQIICVSFEYDGRLTQCYGKLKFTVPAQLLEDCRLMLVDVKGNETELEVEMLGNDATFVLDFSTSIKGHRVPVRMLHLVPAEN